MVGAVVGSIIPFTGIYSKIGAIIGGVVGEVGGAKLAHSMD